MNVEYFYNEKSNSAFDMWSAILNNIVTDISPDAESREEHAPFCNTINDSRVCVRLQAKRKKKVFFVSFEPS